MEIDEYIFSAVDAINDKWTEHAADTKVSDMEKEIARQRAQIESQQEEIDNQRKDLGMLREAVEKIQSHKQQQQQQVHPTLLSLNRKRLIINGRNLTRHVRYWRRYKSHKKKKKKMQLHLTLKALSVRVIQVDS